MRVNSTMLALVLICVAAHLGFIACNLKTSDSLPLNNQNVSTNVAPSTPSPYSAKPQHTATPGPRGIDLSSEAQESAEDKRLKQLAGQLLNDTEFSKLSAKQREQLNSDLRTALREKGKRLLASANSDPEAYYFLANVFLLDIERISKMGSSDERNAMVMAYPKKIKEYLHKYLDGAPTGRYAAKARELLKATE